MCHNLVEIPSRRSRLIRLPPPPQRSPAARLICRPRTLLRPPASPSEVPSSVQSATQPQRHLEHQVLVSSLHPSSDIRPHLTAEHRLQRVRRPQMHPMLEVGSRRSSRTTPSPEAPCLQHLYDRPFSDRRRTRRAGAHADLRRRIRHLPMPLADLRVQRLRQLALQFSARWFLQRW